MTVDPLSVPVEPAPLASSAQQRANLRLGLLLGGIAIAIAVAYMLLLPGRFAEAVRYHQEREAARAAEPAVSPSPPAPAAAPIVPSRGSP